MRLRSISASTAKAVHRSIAIRVQVTRPIGAGRRRRRCNRTVGKRGFVLPAQRLASYAARTMSVARA